MTAPLLTLRRPDDWHLHLRDGDALRAVLPFTARQFARAVVMPNLKPPVTTVQGILEKHTGQVPFDAPQALRDAIARGDFGSTADPQLKTQTVDFLTNLDTTGGNSGSPVLDANGKLIGLNFDSNWEAVSASWMYDPRYKRAIHVDLRYLRWLLAKVYPAPQLLKEMNLPAE